MNLTLETTSAPQANLKKPDASSIGGSGTTANPQQTAKPTCQQADAKDSRPTKTQVVIKLLCRKKGATIQELVKATGWQPHSVRGLISGTIKKKLLLNVVVEKGGKSGIRYRIVTAKGAK